MMTLIFHIIYSELIRKLSKTQVFKIVESRGILGKLIKRLGETQSVKIIQIRSFSCPYFLVFGLNRFMRRGDLFRKCPSIFSPNTEKYRPEKLRIWTLFMQ